MAGQGNGSKKWPIAHTNPGTPFNSHTLPPVPVALTTLADLYRYAAEQFGEQLCCATRYKTGSWQPCSFAKLYRAGTAVAAYLQQQGVRPGDRVALFADHGEPWLVSHCAIMLCGAVVVPRGSDVSADDIGLIAGQAGCSYALLANERLHQACAAARWQEQPLSLPALIHGSEQWHNALLADTNPVWETTQRDAQDVATIIFTSSTTGLPKGVTLSHAALLQQLQQIADAPLPVYPHDRLLSLLPVWHIFELSVTLYAIRQGASLWFTSPRRLAEDLEQVQPTFMASAPRVWETLFARIEQGVAKSHPIRRVLFRIAYHCSDRFRSASRRLRNQVWQDRRPSMLLSDWQKGLALITWLVYLIPHGLFNTAVLETIRQRAGACLRATVSGGGALPPEVDRFFAVLGIPILEGYGMTEIPVVAVRRLNEPCLGSIGRLLPDTEARIVDLNNGTVLWDANHPHISDGLQGELQIRGPQRCAGYWQNSELTAQAEDAGWWRTGDIATVDARGRFAIRGRCKDTIVLRSGENVEPVPLEDRIRRSPLLENVIIVGQDEKFLVALLIPSMPDMLQAGFSGTRAELASNSEWQQRLFKEVARIINRGAGDKAYEIIKAVVLLPEQLQIGRELTNLMKVRRHVVHEHWAELIASCYADSKGSG